MNLVRHCDLCHNQKTNLKEGTTCGLTGRKPDFHKTCSKIVLSEKCKKKLKTVNIEYDKVKKEKKRAYLYFVIFIIVSLSFFIYGYLLRKYVLIEMLILYDGFILDPSLEIMGIGLLPFFIAFGILKKYKQKIEITKSRKDKIDEVLNEYGIEYNIDIKYGEKKHGTQKVFVDLKINGIN